MSKNRSWTDEQLQSAVVRCKSYRAVLIQLGLIPAGGNYVQIQRRIQVLGLDIGHFTGKGWNAGITYQTRALPPLAAVLVKDSFVQSYKLKQRLFREGIKHARCELCGWCQMATDGRIPVKLDHINGDRYDNRLENLRILCPNCHSLQPTHRCKNIRTRAYRARVL